MMYAALFSALAVFFGILGIWRMLGPESFWKKKRQTSDRIFAEQIITQFETPSLEKSFHLSDIGFLQKFLSSRKQSTALSLLLKRAKLDLSVAVFILLSASAGACFFVVTSHFLPLWISLLVALGVLMLPYLWLQAQSKKYLAKFTEYLPNALSIISNSIKVGHSLEAAFAAVAETAPSPVSDEFKVLRAEMKLGQSLEMAMENLYLRIPVPDLKIFITGVSVHQELGGNLSEVLDNLEQTLRDRFALKREIKALSSQGIMSSWVLFAIPIVLLVVWFVNDPKMLLDYAKSDLGRNVMIGAVFVQLLSFLWIKKIINLGV